MGKEIALKNASFAVTKGGNNAVFTGNTKTLAILDKFERQENVGNERKQRVRENRAVREMKKAFREYLEKDLSNISDILYENACQQIKSLADPHIARNVSLFSIVLVQFQEDEYFASKAGIFLSALINTGRGENFAINTENLSVELQHLGHKNTKNITVAGNVGNAMGCYMTSGRITVDGNIGDQTGIAMEGGKILVKGNAGNYTGCMMENGEIMVEGNAGPETGWYMEGGKISVDGNIFSLGNEIKGGDIYQKGRQLVRRGEQIAKPRNK